MDEATLHIDQPYLPGAPRGEERVTIVRLGWVIGGYQFRVSFLDAHKQLPPSPIYQWSGTGAC